MAELCFYLGYPQTRLSNWLASPSSPLSFDFGAKCAPGMTTPSTAHSTSPHLVQARAKARKRPPRRFRFYENRERSALLLAAELFELRCSPMQLADSIE